MFGIELSCCRDNIAKFPLSNPAVVWPSQFLTHSGSARYSRSRAERKWDSAACAEAVTNQFSHPQSLNLPGHYEVREARDNVKWRELDMKRWRDSSVPHHSLTRRFHTLLKLCIDRCIFRAFLVIFPCFPTRHCRIPRLLLIEIATKSYVFTDLKCKNVTRCGYIPSLEICSM